MKINIICGPLEQIARQKRLNIDDHAIILSVDASQGNVYLNTQELERGIADAARPDKPGLL